MLKGFPEPDYISISESDPAFTRRLCCASSADLPPFAWTDGGAWDFLYMYNRDIIEKRFHQSVPEEDLAAFTGTLRGLLRFMSDMFPRSKIVWINVHPLNNEDLAAKHAWGGGYFQPPLDTTQDSVLFPPLFAQRRLTQHAQALRKTAAEEEVDSLDVSHVVGRDYAAPYLRHLTHGLSSICFIVLETQRLIQFERVLARERYRPPKHAPPCGDGGDDL